MWHPHLSSIILLFVVDLSIRSLLEDNTCLCFPRRNLGSKAWILLFYFEEVLRLDSIKENLLLLYCCRKFVETLETTIWNPLKVIWELVAYVFGHNLLKINAGNTCIKCGMKG
jgi:hypothetical protein